MVTPIDEKTGLPYLLHNGAWQGDTFRDRPADESFLLKHCSSKCGGLTFSGDRHFAYLTVPVVGGEAGTLENQTPKKAKNWDQKATRLKELVDSQNGV